MRAAGEHYVRLFERFAHDSAKQLCRDFCRRAYLSYSVSIYGLRRSPGLLPPRVSNYSISNYSLRRRDFCRHAYVFMAYIVMGYVVMAHIVTACIVMAYMVRRLTRRTRAWDRAWMCGKGKSMSCMTGVHMSTAAYIVTAKYLWPI